MIVYKQIDETYFEQYESIPMIVDVDSIYQLQKVKAGLGGILFAEIPTEPYRKDLGVYEQPTKYKEEFDISTWGFFMAFDGDQPIGAVTIVGTTEKVQMLEGREDLCILWDLRVAKEYQKRGVGTTLFQKAVHWAKEQGYFQMKIECQNNNVPACKFYCCQGAVLSKIDEYAYYLSPEDRKEVQLIWYLTL